MKCIACLLLFFIPIYSFSQKKITLTGRVVDTNHKPIAFANVVLLDINNKIITGTVTDGKGEFSLKALKGEYSLSVSFVGYKDVVKTITVEGDLKLNNIFLIKNTSQLGEIVIQAKKKLFEQKVDRLVFNVENSIGASGGDALDALKITPRVKVQNDGISIFGKSRMSVMIDGRLIKLTDVGLDRFFKINSG